MSSYSEASAPGKVILFGEHAVVFGMTAVATAITMRAKVRTVPAGTLTFNGKRIEKEENPYPYHAMEEAELDGADMNVISEIPPGAGLGSSAAVSVAMLASLRRDWDMKTVASAAYRVELLSQGRASPLDTSVSTYGNTVVVSRENSAEELWSIRGREVEWHISSLAVRPMEIVIGYTGHGAPTGPLVEHVRQLHSRFSLAREAIEEIGQIAEEGRRKLMESDYEGVGRLMNRNQRLLALLGVSTKELESLIEAVAAYSYGAKLTGAGGGGCIVVLTDRSEKVADAIRRRGGLPYICRTGAEGMRRHEPEG